MRTFYCIYREMPFEVWFQGGVGFDQPRLDETRGPVCFVSQPEAEIVRRTIRPMNGRVAQIAKRSWIRKRIKEGAHA